MVAHDAKKEVMAELVKRYSEKLSQLNLVATRTTGQNIMEKSGMPVTLLQSGPMGGDQQVGALVVEGKLEAVIFLRDPLFAQPHETGYFGIDACLRRPQYRSGNQPGDSRSGTESAL